MKKVVEKIMELEYLIEGLNSEIEETNDLATQLRLLSLKNDYLEALIVLKKTIKRNRYELTR